MTGKMTKREIQNELWRRGELVWLLDPAQKQLYDLFYQSQHKIMTWLLSRRAGKSYTLCVLALEQCIRKPHSIVKYVSPTKLQIATIVRPLLRQILESCPDDIRPEFKSKDYIYYFPNGSEIQLAGTDGGHCEKLRGGDSNVWFIDEAGSCDDLNNVVKSILLPTTLITKGKGVLASTPPKHPDHEFINFIEEAEMRGSLVKKTIYDNPRITKEQMDELIKELGGINTDEARRELFCEIIKDSNTSVIKEFNDELAKEIVKEWPRPPFFDSYVSMDLGFQDLTAVLFGYYDFRADKIIIEDELPFDFNEQDKHLTLLAQKIEEKEKQLWYNPLTGEMKAPYLRVSDINMIVTNELYKVSNGRLNFLNTRKDDKDSAINNVRVLLANRKIIINPRCQTLIRHLKNAKWDKNKTKFARCPNNSHYDFVDALVYLCRNVILNRNPYPKGYDLRLRSEDAHIQNPDSFYKKFDQAEVFKQLFNMKRKR